MRPITDFNEVTAHFLEAVYCHYFITKGPLGVSCDTASICMLLSCFREPLFRTEGCRRPVLMMCTAAQRTEEESQQAVTLLAEGTAWVVVTCLQRLKL